MATAKCCACKQVKDASEFHKDRSNKRGLQWKCKSCNSELRKLFRKEHPDRVHRLNQLSYARGSEQAKRRYRENRVHYRDYWLKTRYGISLAEYDAMVQRQGGKCAICQKTKRRLDVDHHHASDQVRELLCRSCNIGIGYLQESVEVLEGAIAYLKRHQAVVLPKDAQLSAAVQ